MILQFSDARFLPFELIFAKSTATWGETDRNERALTS